MHLNDWLVIESSASRILSGNQVLMAEQEGQSNLIFHDRIKRSLNNRLGERADENAWQVLRNDRRGNQDERNCAREPAIPD